MRKALSAIYAATLLAACAPVVADEAPPLTCAKRPMIVEVLTTDFAEQPLASGQGPNGLTVELWASRGGAWTVLISFADGVTCIVASGEPTEIGGRSL